MFLEPLAKIIQAEGVATIGTDLFFYSAPAELETYALLVFGGDGIPVDNELPGYYNTKYQVIVRASNYEDGFALAHDIKQALTFYGKKSGNITFNHSLPKDEPRPYRRNEAGIVEFSNNFIVSFVKE
jgi:hypothetical protein